MAIWVRFTGILCDRTEGLDQNHGSLGGAALFRVGPPERVSPRSISSPPAIWRSIFFSGNPGSPVHSRAQIKFFAARIQCLTSRKAKTGGNLPQRSTFGASDRRALVLTLRQKPRRHRTWTLP